MVRDHGPGSHVPRAARNRAGVFADEGHGPHQHLRLCDLHLRLQHLYVFLLTNFFADLPEEIYEAAVLDGAGELRTFIQIMFPLASPVVFSMSILIAVNIWNQFFVPLIFLQNDAKKTIPLMVIKFTKSLLTTVDSAFAVSILSTVPILILFVVFSRKILSGIAEGGVKG